MGREKERKAGRMGPRVSFESNIMHQFHYIEVHEVCASAHHRLP